jgi:hypothetical protein
MVHFLLLKIDHVCPLIKMNNQITITSGILLVTLLLPTVSADFLILAAPNAFGQQDVFDTGTNDSSSVSSGNMTETIPMITVHDVINSTYIAPKAVDEDESERRISRAIRDRINDIAHTVVSSNATIISTATITNSFVDESTTINNHTRFLEIIEDQVEAALAGIRAMSQPANPLLELSTDIESVCIANVTSLADCAMKIRIR